MSGHVACRQAIARVGGFYCCSIVVFCLRTLAASFRHSYWCVAYEACAPKSACMNFEQLPCALLMQLFRITLVIRLALNDLIEFVLQ